MKIISSKSKLQKFVYREKNLGFVPTMGALHLGHIAIVKKCVSDCNKTIVSIFVNRPQFNKEDDYLRYPSSIKKDISILKKLKVDYLYLPNADQIYPNGVNRKIDINPFSKKLCGKFRPGHFTAVADVIDRFIKIINPDKIYFGEKDMQQLKLMEDFINKNYKNIRVIGCKTIREKNGLAFSSRNFLLTNKEKESATQIYRLLIRKKKNIIKKKIPLSTIKSKIFKLGAQKIDYIKTININKIIRPYKKKDKYKIFIAYYLNKVRLIDNI